MCDPKTNVPSQPAAEQESVEDKHRRLIKGRSHRPTTGVAQTPWRSCS